MKFLEELQQSIIINEQVVLADYCTYKIGGPADYLCEPKTVEDLQAVLRACVANDCPYTIIGRGANLLISDKGIRGMVIVLSDAFSQMGFLKEEPKPTDYAYCLSRLQEEAVIDENGYAWLFAQAGVAFIETSQVAAANELTGLEFACGIPGSVGGASYMNAGAYDGTSKDVVAVTYYLNEDFELCAAQWEEHEFSYRMSKFQKEGTIILASCYRLQKGNKEEIDNKIADFTQRRENSQPLELPSCGSVFKRPTGHFAGKLIMDAGLQGKRIGGAEVSKKHAGFIVNVGEAKAADVHALISYIKEVIQEKDGVSMDTEVRYMGDWE